QKVIIVGGVAGGATAAARLRRLDEDMEIILIERGEHISYANCGLPYYIGGIIKNKEDLLVQTPEGMGRRFNLDIRVNNEVLKIDVDEKKVEVLDKIKGEKYFESFDKLILSPGAEPLRPPIPGIDGANIYTLRNVPDTFKIAQHIDNKDCNNAVVVGGGFIGLEMAENLHHRGIKVTLVEMADQVMPPLDFDMAAIVHKHIKDSNIELLLGNGVEAFQHEGEKVIVQLSSGEKLETDMVMLCIGVKPEAKLALDAGLDIGETGGIKVNEYLQTSHPDIYAVGDAIEVVDFISGNPTLIPLAGPANKQGRIAANNICGIEETYKGTQGTSIVKLFDLTVGVTGSNEKSLKKCNIEYMSAYTHSICHAGYYPGSTPMSIKLLFSPKEGKVLGAQIVGYQGVDKRIDVLATAIRAGMTVEDLYELELAYAPPYSSAKDPVNMIGYVASNILSGHQSVMTWNDIDDLDRDSSLILDVRTKEEYKTGTIPGSVNIPLDNLRDNIVKIQEYKDKEISVFCRSGERSYIAVRILMQLGFNKVKNLTGGYLTWDMVN
ncbi:MAG TPA: FAD-dependent oxidoreductase, partial [Clostridia bacterium]|nr:FAD-dependent oxidoreductase [Clostridia bacterium]